MSSESTVGAQDLSNDADAFAQDEPAAGPRNEELEEIVRQMLVQLGENPEREGLVRTPLRVAKALEVMTSGYRMSVDKIINNAVFTESYDEIVSIKNINFFSMCEHHMLPFYGVAHVGYIPDGKVVGLSKIPRLVDMFSKRLQLQERLTTQVAYCLRDVLEPRGVAVIMEGFHLCMMMRGVEKQNCTTVTSCMLGDFRSNDRTRSEFLTLCGYSSIRHFA